MASMRQCQPPLLPLVFTSYTQPKGEMLTTYNIIFLFNPHRLTLVSCIVWMSVPVVWFCF